MYATVHSSKTLTPVGTALYITQVHENGTGVGATGTGVGATGTGLGATGTGDGATGTGLGATGTGVEHEATNAVVTSVILSEPACKQGVVTF